MEIEKHIKTLLRTSNTPIDYKKFDYIEGVTTDDNMIESGFIIRGKRFYHNPIFWYIVIMHGEKEYNYNKKTIFKLANILLDPNDTYNLMDSDIMAMCIKNGLLSANAVITIIKRKKLPIINSIIINCINAKNKNYYEKITSLDWKDEDSSILLDIIKENKLSVVKDLIENHGSDPKAHDSMALSLACKHGCYTIALYLLDKGADINNHNGLPYKRFLINDSKRFCPKMEEASHNTLLSIFKKNIKNKE